MTDHAIWSRHVRLCDGCYETVTELPATCQDDCSLPLSHVGLCDPRTETDMPCGRCGQAGRRLTEHEPQDDEQAAACQPVEFEVSFWAPTRHRVRLNAAAVAERLRTARWPDAAETADQIAPREITEGDARDTTADDTTPGGLGLQTLAYAIAKESEAFGLAGPAGDPSDWDNPEDYHVWVLSGPPVVDGRFGVPPHDDGGTWAYIGTNLSGHRLYSCSRAAHVFMEAHPHHSHQCRRVCASPQPAPELTGEVAGDPVEYLVEWTIDGSAAAGPAGFRAAAADALSAVRAHGTSALTFRVLARSGPDAGRWRVVMLDGNLSDDHWE